MRLHLIALIVFLAPALARADSTTPATNEPTFSLASGGTVAAYGMAACQGNVEITVAYNYANGISQYTPRLTIFGTDLTACPTTADASRTLVNALDITSSNQSGSYHIAAQTLFGTTCPGNTNKDYLICAISTEQQQGSTGTGTSDVTIATDKVTVTYDSQQPATPTLSSVVGGDGKVYLTWATQSDVDRWTIYYRVDGPPPPPGSDICGNVGGGSGGTNIPLCDPNDDAGGRWCDGSIPDDAATPTPDAGPVTPSFDFAAWCAAGGFSVDDSANCGYRKVTDGTATTGEVLGLVNGQQYAFSLVGEDLAGNVSGGSDPVDGTPEVVLDFYRRYRCAGGAEKGGFGCSTSTAGALLIPVVGAGILALVRRRRRP